MSRDAALEQIEQTLSETRSEKQILVNQQGVISHRLKELNEVEAGLVQVLKRMGRHDSDQASGDLEGLTISQMNRPQAITEILRRAERPIAPKEITARLKAEGREEKHPNAVYNALTKLKRNGIIVQVGPGKWWIKERTDDGNVAQLRADSGGGSNLSLL